MQLNNLSCNGREANAFPEGSTDGGTGAGAPSGCAEPPSRLLTLEQARHRIRAAIRPVDGVERLPLKQARGRILAENIIAPADLPAFAGSAMDGYAVRAGDLDRYPRLRVIGTAWAGKPFPTPLGAGECVRIFTGAPVPDLADAVIPQEDVARQGDEIAVRGRVGEGEHVRSRGDEALEGDLVLAAGRRLTPEDLGLIATLGIPEVMVRCRPRVAFLTTGSELRAVGEPLAFGQIHDSNRYLLEGLLAELGVESIDLGTVRDDREALREALSEAAELADAIVTTGGASVGDADLLVEILDEIGHVEFWKVALKPGKPFVFGRVGRSFLFGLPGNPVSALVTFRQLARPGLWQLMGASAVPPLRLKAVCTGRLGKQPGRAEFRRGVYRLAENGNLVVTALAKQGSHQLTALSSANCFIVLPVESSGVETGQSVEIEPFINP
jgi:molybdopterin molybdotransferase